MVSNLMLTFKKMQEWFGSILFCCASSAEVKRITVLLGELGRRVPVDLTAGPPRLSGRAR